MKKFYCLFTILVLCSYGCKKENDFEFVHPSISLNSIEIVAPNQAQLKVTVDLGAGFNGHRAWLQLTDISTPANQPSLSHITLTQEPRQEHTLTVNAPVAGNDYQVMGVLETEKNHFETGKQYMFFSRKSHKYDVKNPYVQSYYFTPDYPFVGGNVARIVQGGENIAIMLNNEGAFDIGKMKVTLDNSIELECEEVNEILNFDSSILATIPVGLSPGDYTVQLCLDDEKWEVDGLIRVLPWKTDFVELPSTHPYSYYSVNASFRIGNRIYYAQFSEHNIIENYIEYKTWYYDIETGTWTSVNNWRPTECTPMLGASAEGKGYCVFRHDNGETYLWSYTPETDEWKPVSLYPGKGKNGFVYFASGHYVYMGGGVYWHEVTADPIGVNDFWQFNVLTQEWKQMADIPFTPVDNRSVNSTCTDGETAYTFFYDRTLWSYHVPTDAWMQEGRLDVGPFFRYGSPLCMWEGKVCLLGSVVDLYEQYTDVQLYDPVTKEWAFLGLFDFNSFMSIWFIPSVYQKDGAIYMGPLQQLSNDVYNPPAPRFIRIKPQ